MVLTYVRGWDNFPKELNILTEQEANAHQVKVISNWEKPSEVFFLKYGHTIAGFATFLSSFPIVQHFRKQFKLSQFGRLATYLPACIMPGFLTYYGYYKLVTSEIVLMKMRCPLCMEFRYAAYHICTSLIYTTAIAALGCSSIAFARKTCYVPPPQAEGKLFLKVIWNMIKAGVPRYQAITTFQLLIILSLPYLQVQEFSHLRESIIKKERSEIDPENIMTSENFSEPHSLS